MRMISAEFHQIGRWRWGVLSPDGRCRTFRGPRHLAWLRAAHWLRSLVGPSGAWVLSQPSPNGRVGNARIGWPYGGGV
jgi:hypothetical protein